MKYSDPVQPLGRRLLLTAATALPLVSIRSRPARAAEFSYRLALGTGITALINARLEQATGRIREATGGRLEIRSFPATELGSDDEQLARLQSGAVELLNTTGSRLTSIAPAASITNLGFVFTGYEAIWPAMDGGFGSTLRAAIEKSGVLVVSKASDNGLRQITSSEKPIRGPEDLSGFRIRLPDILTFTALFKSLGAVPASAGIRELKPMLQARTIDGQENNLAAIDFIQLAGAQKYVSMTNHIWDPFWLVGNKQALARLPDDVHAVMRQEFDRASVEQREDVARQDTALRIRLPSEGFEFVEVDQAPFRAALAKAGYYSDFKQRFAPDLWAALQEAVGPLA